MAIEFLKEENRKLREALLNILKERGDVYGDVDMQCLWKAIEEAKPLVTTKLIGRYGYMNDKSLERSMTGDCPGPNASVRIIAVSGDTFTVNWSINAGDSHTSVVPRDWVDLA